MLEKEFFFVLLHASAHLPICPGSGSGFVSFLTDPDPTFIMQIRIRITVFFTLLWEVLPSRSRLFESRSRSRKNNRLQLNRSNHLFCKLVMKNSQVLSIKTTFVSYRSKKSKKLIKYFLNLVFKTFVLVVTTRNTIKSL